MPSLSKQLKAVTDCIIGLQFVWEYRSPSKSVPPHYQCKLCAVTRLQHDMLAHVRGWKHCFRYLKKVYPDKISQDEGEAIKDPAVRKIIKDVAADVEKTEGRGQLRVVLKEPCDVPAFKGLRTAAPKVRFPPPGMGSMGPPSFGPRFSGQRFSEDFPSQDGPLSDYSTGGMEEPGFGGYFTQDFHDSGTDQRPFPDDSCHRPAGDGFGRGGGRGRYGRSSLLGDSPSRMYPDEFLGNQSGSALMNKPMEGQGLMGAAPESSSLPNTLLTYLDTFRIENESDAQLVLKVTQKLTDVLMEYRLRSVSAGSSLNSFSLSSTSFSSTPSRLPSSSRYSSSLSGPSKFSGGPPRYYK
ncbi:uncharacterized protein si:ch211-197h24.6 isoform X2 [Brachionichthys hirsutus]